MDDEYKLKRRNFELALVEIGGHYNTHLVNNDEEEDGFHCSCHDLWRPWRPQVYQKRQKLDNG